MHIDHSIEPVFVPEEIQLVNALAEITSALDEVEGNSCIYQEENFSQRMEMLDFIEFHVIDRIDGLYEKANQQDSLTWLKKRAEELRTTLEKINSNLFLKLRILLNSRNYTGPEFIQIVNAYVNVDRQGDGEDIGYDDLDIFINGLCQFRAMPEQTRELEPEMVYYQKTPARVVFELIDQIDLISEDVFVDLGSGMGQVVLLFHLLTGKKAKGIEYDPAYCDYAINCASELNLANVTFINADVRKAELGDGTLFFMFTPFKGEILHEVLFLLKEKSRRRKIRIITYGPCTEYVAGQDWLKCLVSNTVHNYQLNVFVSLPDQDI
jgi:hypothetical protein